MELDSFSSISSVAVHEVLLLNIQNLQSNIC